MPPSPSASAPDSTARKPTTVQLLAGWKKAAAILVGMAMRVWGASLRITLDDPDRRLFACDARPTLFILWHNRLFVAAELMRRFRPGRPLHALISASKDGAWLSAFFESVGLRAVRGSSSRGGREAAAELVRVLRAGHDVGITPDGPRGPIYECKGGAAVVARRAGVRVVALGICYESAWTLRSWDRFLVPRPFSRVKLYLREVAAGDIAAPDAPARMETALRAINPDTPPET